VPRGKQNSPRHKRANVEDREKSRAATSGGTQMGGGEAHSGGESDGRAPHKSDKKIDSQNR